MDVHVYATGLTQDGQVTDQVVRVVGVEDVDKLQVLGEFSTDDRSDIEMLSICNPR